MVIEQTNNGIKYDWWLAGPDGASFMLYPEPHHTMNDIKEAKRQLRYERDVVTIHVKRKEEPCLKSQE